MPEALKSQVGPRLAVRVHLNQQIAFSRTLQRLSTAPGVGPVVATLDAAQRFNGAHQVESFPGLIWRPASRIPPCAGGRVLPSMSAKRNPYGSQSQRGTEVVARFYSLLETARLRGEDPGHSLRRAVLAAGSGPGTLMLPKSQS
jgi:hypothetical protein